MYMHVLMRTVNSRSTFMIAKVTKINLHIYFYDRIKCFYFVWYSQILYLKICIFALICFR